MYTTKTGEKKKFQGTSDEDQYKYFNKKRKVNRFFFCDIFIRE